MPIVVLIPYLVLLRAVVRRCDERTLRAVDETYRLVVRLDILEYIFYPLDRKIIPHYTDHFPFFVFYLKRMGSDECLRTGADIGLRPIAVAVASQRSGVPVARIIIQMLFALRSSNRLTFKTVRMREIIVHLAAINTRRQLNEYIVNVRIAVKRLARRF